MITGGAAIPVSRLKGEDASKKDRRAMVCVKARER